MNTTKQKIKGIAVICVVSFVFFTNISAAFASEINPAKMLELTNKSRSEAGLDVLISDEKLNLAAQAKAEDMFKHQYFEHTSPEGVTPWYWFDLVGYDYVYAAENLALDFTTAEGVHSALMKSTGHRENILGVNYGEVGIAVMSGNFKGKTSIIVVEEFGTERQKKASKISDDFFEESNIEPEKTPAAKAKASPKDNSVANGQQRKNNTVVETQQQIVPIYSPNTNLAPKASEEPIQQSVETSSSGLGKVVPQIYSVRSARTLKKVYVENIYWEKTDGEDLTYSLDHSKAIIKALLRDLTNRQIYRLINS